MIFVQNSQKNNFLITFLNIVGICQNFVLPLYYFLIVFLLQKFAQERTFCSEKWPIVLKIRPLSGNKKQWLKSLLMKINNQQIQENLSKIEMIIIFFRASIIDIKGPFNPLLLVIWLITVTFNIFPPSIAWVYLLVKHS